MRILAVVILAALLVAGGEGIREACGTEVISYKMSGTASWYAEFSPGIRPTTANMERFDDSGMTCAMWDVPFNTFIRVTNVANGKSVLVRVNDRGPAKRLVREGRVIDLTMAAFAAIADLDRGLIEVKLEVFEAAETAAS